MAFSRGWTELLSAVAEAADGAGPQFFRGQEWQGWGLVPALGRLKCASGEEFRAREARLFTGFQIRAGNLLNNEDDAWRIAFLIQHHGLPTRLLDWSASFAIALWRAREDEGDAVVWVLDAASLNRAVGAARNCCSTARSRGDYEEYFIARTKAFPFPVVGLAPSRSPPRLQQQRGFFTLHRDLDRSLEETHPQVLTKIVVPSALFGDARAFLRLSGVNEFSLFPDLDGLARHLRVTQTGPRTDSGAFRDQLERRGRRMGRAMARANDNAGRRELANATELAGTGFP